MIQLKQLLEIGFKYAGKWTLDNGDLALNLVPAQEGENALYAFIVNEDVKYIGKTTKSLRERLYHYLKPGPRQSTNIKNNANILTALNAGKSVEVFALLDDGSRRIGAFHLNVAAGLEDSLIVELRPEWNGSKKTRKVNVSPIQIPAVHTFYLRPTYFEKGFFNAPVTSERYYGADDTMISIFCGNPVPL